MGRRPRRLADGAGDPDTGQVALGIQRVTARVPRVGRRSRPGGVRRTPRPAAGNGAATAVWTPAKPTGTVAGSPPDADAYEVRVYDSRRDGTLVAAVEFVSPSNKDRPETRHAFVAKCAGLLRERVRVAIVDDITERRKNLYRELLADDGIRFVSRGISRGGTMHAMPRKSAKPPSSKWYRGADVPMRVIRRFARQVAERFAPEKIILFGSHAYGTPHADSDVDILVVMPCRNQIDQACRIDRALDPPFPLDLIVRTPYSMAWRLKEGESFLTEVTTKGKVLSEAPDARVGSQSRSPLPVRAPTRRPP
ncbi:MAG: nucleotidyltransferase domain-containing protein [Gemmataceae bacterium]